MKTRKFSPLSKDTIRARGLWIALVPILVALFFPIQQAPGNFHQLRNSVYADTGSRASGALDGITFSIGGEKVVAQRQGDWVNGTATFCLLEVPTGAPWGFLSDAGVDNCLAFSSRVPGMANAMETQYRPSGTWDFGGITISDPVFHLRFVGDGSPMETQWRVSVVSLSGKVADGYRVDIGAERDSSGKWFWRGSADTDALNIGDLKAGDFVSINAQSVTVAKEMGSPSSDATLTVQGTFAMGWEESSFSMPTKFTIAREGTGKDREYILTGTMVPTLESRLCLPDTEVARGVCINLNPKYEIEVENRASDIRTLFQSAKNMKVSTLTEADLGPAVEQILSDLNIKDIPVAEVYFEDGKLVVGIPIDQEISIPENDPDGLTGVFRTLKVAYDVSSKRAEVAGDLMVDLPTVLNAGDGGEGLVADLVYRGKNMLMNIQPPEDGLTLLDGVLRVEEMGWEQVEGATLFSVTGQLHVEDPNTGDYLDVDVDNMVIMVAPFPMIFVDNLSASGELLGFGAGIENVQLPFPYEVFAGQNPPVAGKEAGVPVGLSVGNIWLKSEDPVWKELIGEPGGVLATGSFSSPQLMLPRLGEDPFSPENLPGTMFQIIFAITGETEGRIDLNVPGLATGAGYRIDSAGVLVNGMLNVTGDVRAKFAVTGMLGPDSYRLSGNGMMGILGAQSDTTIRISEKGFNFQLVGDVYGQFAATIKVDGENIGESNGVDVYAAMKGEFLSYLQDTLLAQAREDLAAVNGDIAQAQADVEYAQGEVDKIIKEIERLRRLVQAERDRDLESAREDVATAQTGVTYAQNQVNKVKGVITSKERQRDKLRNRKSCKTIRYWVPTPKWYDLGAGYWKSKRVCVPDAGAQAQAAALDAEIAGLRADLAAKNAALAAAREALKVARAALQAADAEINQVPVDLDPRLVAKFAERDAAKVALDVAREALKVAEDGSSTATEAVELAQMVKIKSASFEGKLGTLTGSKVTLRAEVMVNNQSRTVAVDFNFKDVPGSTAALMTKLLEA